MNGDFAKRFHHQSTHEWRRVAMLPEAEWPKEWKERPFKTYPRFESFPLAEFVPLDASLKEALTRRKSSNSLDKEAFLDLKVLATILDRSAGIRDRSVDSLKSFRFYPSAGARYPIEIYVFAQRIKGLEVGIYHYNTLDSSLERFPGESRVATLKKGLLKKVSDAAAIIILTTVWDRTFPKYNDFGYRLMCMEAGHLSQNIQLVGQALSLRYLSMVGFSEKKVDEALGLDPQLESSLYVTALSA